MDELKEDFDVTIVGTGVSQCILAGSLARAGMKVLHLDENDYYGGEISTFQFSSLIEWANGKRNHKKLLDRGTVLSFDVEEVMRRLNVTKREELIICGVDKEEGYGSDYQIFEMTTLKDEEEYNKFMNLNFELPPLPSQSTCHPATMGYTLEKIKWRPASHVDNECLVSPIMFGYNLSKRICPPLTPLENLTSQSRQVNLDLAPRVMLCQGSLVEFLVRSGVGSYLEFKAMEASYVYVPSTSTDKKGGDAIKRVPCSKKEIFQNTYLPVKDKRVLMKFLQFSFDYYTNENVVDIAWLNEASLQQGRSLKRPQNKSVIEYDFPSYIDKPLNDFLDHCGLSPTLQTIALYSIALLVQAPSQIYKNILDNKGEVKRVNGFSASDGMLCIGKYLHSLGKYGSSAFLLPMYGSAEISQSFARLCAVYGGVYMLNNRVSNVIYNKESNKIQGIIDGEGRVIKTRWIVCNDNDVILKKERSKLKKEKQVVVCRSIVILDKSLFPEIDSGFLVIPPSSVDINNAFVIQVLQMSSSTQAVPLGFFVVYLSTLASEKDISGKEANISIQNAINSLFFDKYKERRENDTKKPNIIWKLNFSHSLIVPEEEDEEEERIQEFRGIIELSSKSTLHSENHVQIHFEDAAREAKRIFHFLCPEKEFLEKNQTTKDMELKEEEEEIELMNINEDSTNK